MIEFYLFFKMEFTSCT